MLHSCHIKIKVTMTIRAHGNLNEVKEMNGREKCFQLLINKRIVKG
jgi:hypothetical protein